jgi:hypothetical protein
MAGEDKKRFLMGLNDTYMTRKPTDFPASVFCVYGFIMLIRTIYGEVMKTYKFQANHLICLAMVLFAIPELLDSIVLLVGNGNSVMRTWCLIFALPSLLILPVIGIIDLLWILYFVVAGKSFINLKIRKQNGKEYYRLLPHLVCWIIVVVIFWFNVTFVDRHWYDFP